MNWRHRISLGSIGLVVIIAAGWTIARNLGGPESPRVRTRGAENAAPAAAGSPDRPNLWLLSVGVSRYHDSKIGLQFADADAQAIADAFATQAQGRVYHDVNVQVLTNEAATRERIIEGMQRFLNRAGPQDVAVIFLAGHGIRDNETESYYFLPYAATLDTVRANGLRMSDFNEELRVLHRNVQRVVLLLDTCHAGALNLSGVRALPAGEDLTSQIAAAEGLYVLGSSKPGEQSREAEALQHGAFTFALLNGLAGAADGDQDGLISVSDLFAFTAKHVPVLTEGRQHPYHDIRGTDLVFAAAGNRPIDAPAPAAVVAAATLAPLPTPMPHTVGVAELRNVRDDPEHDWIGQALGAAFSTELGKVHPLRVVAAQLIERKVKSGTDVLDAARQLGIAKLLTGRFAVVGNDLRIDAWIVDTTTGLHEAADSAQGEVSRFFDLEKELVLKMLRRLPVQVAETAKDRIEEENNTDVDSFRQLLEMEGVVGKPKARPKRPAARAPERLGFVWPRSLRFAELLVGRARAADTGPDADAGVRAFLEDFRRAHEVKDIDRLASLYLAFSDRQRAATQAYLRNASDLSVEFADVTIEPEDNDVIVTYTRRDRFVDRSGKTQRLEVQVIKTLVRENGSWKIAE
jgi:uncharacterized caspase-like protein